MKATKKQKQIQEIEKKVANVCDNNDSVVDELTGITYPKKSSEVESKNKSKGLTISLSFGKSAPPLKQQIENQGYEISNIFIENAQEIIKDLHCLKGVGILKEKELIKCFKRLNKSICMQMINSQLKAGEKAIIKKVKENIT